MKQVQSAYWAFCSFQKGVSHDKGTSFFSWLVILLILVTGLNVLGVTSKPDVPCYLIFFISACKTSYLLCTGILEGEVSEGMRVLCHIKACCHCLLSSKSVLPARWRENRENPLLNSSIHLFLKPSHSPVQVEECLNLGTSSTGVLAPAILTLHKIRAQPAPWNLGGSMFPLELYT